MNDSPRFAVELPEFIPRQVAADFFGADWFDAIEEGATIECAGPMFDVSDDDDDDDETSLRTAYLYVKTSDGLHRVPDDISNT